MGKAWLLHADGPIAVVLAADYFGALTLASIKLGVHDIEDWEQVAPSCYRIEVESGEEFGGTYFLDTIEVLNGAA